MTKYEYTWADSFDQLNELGKEGWRFVPGSHQSYVDRNEDDHDSFMMERELEVIIPESIRHAPNLIPCGATSALSGTCLLQEGHLAEGMPHQWTPFSGKPS